MGNNNIAKTILEQLGGNKFTAMTGANTLVDLGNGLQFSFKGSRKSNKMRILLNENDLYNITFWKVGKFLNFKLISEHKGIYAEDLQELFTRETGLYTSL